MGATSEKTAHGTTSRCIVFVNTVCVTTALTSNTWDVLNILKASEMRRGGEEEP